MIIGIMLAACVVIMAFPNDKRFFAEGNNFAIETFSLFISFCSIYAVMLGTISRGDGALNAGAGLFGGLVLFFVSAAEKKSAPAGLAIIQVIIAAICLYMTS